MIPKVPKVSGWLYALQGRLTTQLWKLGYNSAAIDTKNVYRIMTSYCIYFIYYMCACVHMCKHVHVSWRMCGSLKTICRIHFSPFFMWVPRIELRSSDLVVVVPAESSPQPGFSRFVFKGAHKDSCDIKSVIWHSGGWGRILSSRLSWVTKQVSIFKSLKSHTKPSQRWWIHLQFQHLGSRSRSTLSWKSIWLHRKTLAKSKANHKTKTNWFCTKIGTVVLSGYE